MRNSGRSRSTGILGCATGRQQALADDYDRIARALTERFAPGRQRTGRILWVISPEALAVAVRTVQALPYAWPAPPDAAGTRSAGFGTCAGKHAVLREDLAILGLITQRLMVVGPLVPSLWPDLAERAGDLLEVHECVTVETSWAGPLLLDVTWHPAAVQAGLTGTLVWDGTSDMDCAVTPVASYAVADDRFREQKELLRSRLYSPAQRAVRDEVLAEMARRATAL